MCGLVGQFGRWHDGDADRWLRTAVDALGHRGPDDRGTWTDAEAEVHLGHTRLSIVDLSPGGHQPYVSASGRFICVYNGEIYNHQALRRELEAAGTRFRSTSDTEVLVAAIERWGLPAALRRANGAFSLGVWDRDRRELLLARDRIGEKPLFVQRRGASVRFASELKALRVAGGSAPAVDRASLGSYLRLGYVPAPFSIHEGITKVRPGTILAFRDGAVTERPYWELPEVGTGPVGPEAEAELETLVRDAVALRREADVPVGAFLSGGIDSSLVTAVMADLGSTVRTFTIGFHQSEFDESTHAARIAGHLGTDHSVLHVSDEETRAVVPSLPTLFDEPFADQSAIPTALVAALARRHVTVALSGDGGDELFGGYTRYRRAALAAPFSLVPSPVARAVATSAAALGRRVPRAASIARTTERVGLGMAAAGSGGLYRSLVSLWERPAEILVEGGEQSTALDADPRWGMGQSLVRTAMAVDLVTYLPDDILVKVDRTTMAVGLEARVPLLDPRLVEWSRRNARPSTRRTSELKAPLRRLLSRYVPPELYERPKMGFGAPVGAWLRGPLREWAEDLLSPAELARGDLFNPEPIRRRWEGHTSGMVDQSFPLWAVLMFQAWRRCWDVP